MSQLFSEDTVFISKQKEKEKVFKEIAGKKISDIRVYQQLN